MDQIISDIPKDELRRLILQEFYETKEPKVDKTQVQRIVDNVKLQLDEILRKQPKKINQLPDYCIRRSSNFIMLIHRILLPHGQTYRPINDIQLC